MKKAYVYSVFPSLQQSWKIAAALDVGGHGGPGPDHGHRRPHRQGPAHDPGGGEAQHEPRDRAQVLVPDRGGRAVHSRCSPTCRSCRCCRETSAPSAPRPFAWTAGSPSRTGARSAWTTCSPPASPRPQAAGARGGAPGVRDGQRLPEGHRGAPRPERHVLRDHPERVDPAGLDRARGTDPGGLERRRQGAAAHLPRRFRDGNHPDGRPRERPRRHLLAAGGRRGGPHRRRAAGDAPALHPERPGPARPGHQRPSQGQPLYARLDAAGGRSDRVGRVPAIAPRLRAVGPGRLGAGDERRPHPQRRRVGLRAPHRLRGRRLARTISLAIER